MSCSVSYFFNKTYCAKYNGQLRENKKDDNCLPDLFPAFFLLLLSLHANVEQDTEDVTNGNL
jgi:hypothetical protein